MTDQSRTPRTDAAVATVTVPFEREEKILVTEAVPADFARTLELEAADLRDLCERLKIEAQIHAQEARTANATIAEIYQIVTGKTGEPGNWNGAEPVRSCIKDLRERLAAEIDARRDGFKLLVEDRGVRTACDDCGGLGTKVYGSTATWRGGVGGQAMTTDVCDKCWGSGDSEKKWPSHSEIESLRERLAKAREAATTVKEMLELGDTRLMAGDGPCGGQLPQLSPDEWGKVYRACKRIIKNALAHPKGEDHGNG